jgi:hypothetical protein
MTRGGGVGSQETRGRSIAAAQLGRGNQDPLLVRFRVQSRGSAIDRVCLPCNSDTTATVRP